jgi:hypothetical protein
MWTAFNPIPDGCGGDLRAAQIVELCADAGFQVRRIVRAAGSPGPPDSILKDALVGHKGTRLLLWEDTSVDHPVRLAKEHGFAVIALPQNVESLKGTVRSAVGLAGEATALSMADRIFCISEEESWLLANLGLSSDFLPYFPARAKCAGLERIARRRGPGMPSGAPWVVLGSADHPPTREGMTTLLRWVQPALREGIRVVVGGFGTEKLAAGFPGPGIGFLGALSGAQMEDLMAGARGLLVHQDRGAGALTRIPEALLAGVPVIASRLAARSSRGYDGISVYDTQDQLLALMRSGGGKVARPPSLPVEAAGRFAAALGRATNRNP